MKSFDSSGRSHIPAELVLTNGMMIALVDFESHIEHVRVQWGGFVASNGLGRDEEALITSILVVPPQGNIIGAEEDYGDLTLEYNNAYQRFRAPVIALANHYHGLSTAAALLQRTRIVIDPSAGWDDWMDSCVFSGALHSPMHFREGLAFEMRHVVPSTGDAGPYRSAQASDHSGFVVEIQALIKRKRGVPTDKPFFAMKSARSART